MLLAHLRLIQIQTLFKEYKWAKYIDGDIDELRAVIIDKLLSSNTTLDILKRELKNEFE